MTSRRASWWRRSADVEWSGANSEVLARHTAVWRLLTHDERERLVEGTRTLVDRFRWESSRGFTLDDGMRIVIAGQAALLVLELGIECYDQVTSVIVHPSTITFDTVRAGPGPGLVTSGPEFLDGEAHHRGPVVLSWDAVRDDVRHPAWGTNVVLHEFAHRLDMLDNLSDGTPPLGDADRLARWVEVCTREFDAVRSGGPDPVLRPYAGENVAEFFAVATEVFFCRPLELRTSKPALYGVLADFYRQDYAARLDR